MLKYSLQNSIIFCFKLKNKLIRGKSAIGLVVTDVLNTQRNGYVSSAADFYYTRRFKIDTRAVLVTFAYTFGSSFKEEILENKFSND